VSDLQSKPRGYSHADVSWQQPNARGLLLPLNLNYYEINQYYLSTCFRYFFDRNPVGWKRVCNSPIASPSLNDGSLDGSPKGSPLEDDDHHEEANGIDKEEHSSNSHRIRAEENPYKRLCGNNYELL